MIRCPAISHNVLLCVEGGLLREAQDCSAAASITSEGDAAVGSSVIVKSTWRQVEVRCLKC